MSRESRKSEASPNRHRLVELSKVVEIINRPGDLMWASAQDWLIEQMDALASPVSESTATDEGYPGIAHDLETLRSALGAMCEEFRGLDLPYGSKAYTQATTALNATRRPLWKQP